jgi:hypothetical protein
MRLFSGESDKSGIKLIRAFDDAAACKTEERTGRKNPGWIVMFGSFTKQFICFPKFPAPVETIITVLYPDAIPSRMRMIERMPQTRNLRERPAG